ncbi:hypothetical protein [Phenylobacterium sp.]|uniref:hypothetical protein n=1 Tax=Phenylobacterium sp. TaxID=1871053 RepID=UPI0025E9C222|nr:hypothetical protein [Phenylobacterium sp.]
MTPDGMTPERFETLAEAYGGDVARWPDAEREAAAQAMAARPAWAQAALARAGDLDAALDAYGPPRAAAGLMDRIVADAPTPRRAWRWTGWLAPAGLGAGLAAACAAGMILGARLSTPAIPETDSVVTAVTADDTGAYPDEEA